jgi:6-pyruvoyltetrahydropterin/6-carboxytetrahydropterin synthase
MYHLAVKRHFDAAHRLENYKGKCATLHGHRWDVEVGVCRTFLQAGVPFVIDFKVLKGTIDEELEKLDHQYINTVLGLSDPTAERLAEYLYHTLEKIGILEYVTVWETPECFVTYREDK